QRDALVGICNVLAHQIFPGDAEMRHAARQLRGDLAGREIGDLDIVEARDRAAIVARATGLRQLESCTGEKGLGVLLKAALGGNGQNEWRAHDLSSLRPIRVSASTQTEKPTAGIGSGDPSWVISPS